MRPWIRSLSNILPKRPLRAYQGNPFTKYSNCLAPAGILGEPFYKIFQKFGPCGHIKGALLQNSQNSRRVGRVASRRVVSKNVFTGTYFGFDICNPKLLTLKNRSSIVPSLQNLYFIHFLMIFISKQCQFRTNVQNDF